MNNIRHKKNLNLGIKFTNLVFLVTAFFFLFILLFASYKVYSNFNNIDAVLYWNSLGTKENTLQFYILCIALSLIVIIFLIVFYFRLKNSTKVNLSIVLFTIGFSFFAFEIYLNLSNFFSQKLPCGYDTRCGAAKEMGIAFDQRLPIQVIHDLTNQGKKVYPNYSIRMLIDSNGLPLDSEEDKIFPLGGISNITTILTNEAGYYPIIERDEHGFNNPKGLYDKGQKDFVLIGDSLAIGYSVKADENMSAVFRKLGFDVLNFGMEGTGTLTQFAIFMEYAKYHRPKTVLWFYNDNDIYNLEKEMESNILMNYLHYQDFNQNLMSKQNEIDQLLNDYFTAVEKSRIQKVYTNSTLFKIFKLSYTRFKIKNILAKYQNKEVKPSFSRTFVEDRDKIIVNREKVFKKILVESKKSVEAWGGKIYFIFLPAWVEDTTGNELKYKRAVWEDLIEEEKYRQFMFNSLIKEDIPFIDMWDVISVHPDPQSFCPLRRCAHYNAEGYRFVAETVHKRLKNDGIH